MKLFVCSHCLTVRLSLERLSFSRMRDFQFGARLQLLNHRLHLAHHPGDVLLCQVCTPQLHAHVNHLLLIHESDMVFRLGGVHHVQQYCWISLKLAIGAFSRTRAGAV